MTAIAKSELPCLDGIVKNSIRRVIGRCFRESRNGGKPAIAPELIDLMRADQVMRRLGEAGYEIGRKKVTQTPE